MWVNQYLCLETSDVRLAIRLGIFTAYHPISSELEALSSQRNPVDLMVAGTPCKFSKLFELVVIFPIFVNLLKGPWYLFTAIYVSLSIFKDIIGQKLSHFNTIFGTE